MHIFGKPRDRWIVTLLAAVLMLQGGCASTPEQTAWVHQDGIDHPLVGRIWSVGERRFVSEEQLLQRLSATRFVLLGERHDNRDHHLLQARILKRLLEAERRPTVAFEMIDSDKTAALASHLRQRPKDAAGLGEAVGWGKSGWPAWSTYQPIAEVAMSQGLNIVPANLPRAQVRRSLREGLDFLSQDRRVELRLVRPLPAAQQTELEAEIRESHCNLLPSELIPGMAVAQRLRDAVMADALLTTEDDGAVLIAGAGHVRTDRGVPLYLRQRAPRASIASVAFREVPRGGVDPKSIALPYDYVWFTTQADNEDPCIKMRRAS